VRRRRPAAEPPLSGGPVLRLALPWVLPAAVVGSWMALSWGGWVAPYLLPPPEKVLATGMSYIFAPAGQGPYAGRFLGDAAASLTRVAWGFGLAAALGLPLGLTSGRLALVSRLMNGLVNGLRAVPGIAWLPLALVWFGIGLGATVFLVALAAFFPIYLGAAAGAAQVNPLHLRSGAMLGLGTWQRVFAVLVPAAMGHVVTGLRLGLGIAFAYLVLGELTGVARGLGAVIMDARLLGRVDVIMVGIITIAVIGRLADVCLVAGLRLSFKSARRLAHGGG